MTRDSDIERILDRWFADGPDQVADDVIDVVAHRIGRQRQRPAWRLDRRLHTVNANAKLAAAIAALFIVAAGGLIVLRPGTSNIGGPPATPSPAPTLSPAQSPVAMPDGVLHAGTYVTQPFPYDPLRATFRVPEGWQGYGGWSILGPSDTGAPDGIGVSFVTVSGLVAQPCRTAEPSAPQPSAMSIGPTVDDLVAALVAHGGYTASTPTDTMLSGYAGKQLDLQLPADLSGCSGHPENYSIWEENGGAGLFAQGLGSTWHLRIVDVNGLRLMLVVGDYVGTPATYRAQAQSIVDSIVLQPGRMETPAPSPSTP